MPPSASSGSAVSGSASTSSHRSLGAVVGERLDRRRRDVDRRRLERRDPAAAADRARRRREVGLGERGAIEQRFGMLDEHQRRIGQPHAAAGLLEQPHAGLALEHRELLGDGATA